MGNVKFVAVSRGLKDILDYVTNREKTVESLITGVNCVAESALDEFEAVKKHFHKTEGRSYYHIVHAFAPDASLDFETAHEIGLKFAEQFKGYQCLVVTHMNTAHIHNHIVMNSVSFENGQKFHQSAKEMEQVKKFSNELCQQYGLSVTETKADRKHIPEWKRSLRWQIKKAMEESCSHEEFIGVMNFWGYGVSWEPGQKYITYTTPEKIKCRDNKLFDDTLLRKNMENYFAMGGCEYLGARQLDEPQTTVDDAVCGIASIIQALQTGDNDRFHMETLHHSDEEIEMLLRQGKKIESGVQIMVDDEEEKEQEYWRYHCFDYGMGGMGGI